MNYGLYLSASGVLTNMYRQDVFANNLANVQTTGFKPDLPELRHRKPATIEDGLAGDVSNRLLEQLGGGVLAGPQRINFNAGSLIQTGNPLDVALTDKHSFFVIDAVDATGTVQTSLTRDGRFQTNADGQLITQNGDTVRGADGRPIIIPPGGAVAMESDGTIARDGQALGRLMVTRVDDTSTMEKRGGNRFTLPRGMNPTQNPDAVMRSGFTEASGVDPVAMLMNVTNAAKSATSNARMIQYHDQMLDRAVNTLGRVA